jgi:hypothetical protein
VLFAVTAAAVPAASAAATHVSSKSSASTKISATAGGTTKTKTGSAAHPQDALPDQPSLNGAYDFQARVHRRGLHERLRRQGGLRLSSGP